MIRVTNQHANAVVYLRGAQVTSYQPRGQQELLWFSRTATRFSDYALGGGVPICWPWFARAPGSPLLPFHGFARISDWTLQSVKQGGDERTTIHMSMTPSEEIRLCWQEPLSAACTIVVGPTLEIELTTRNVGSRPVRFQEGFHTYFAVSDFTRIAISGLKGAAYVDHVQGVKPGTQEGDLQDIPGEIDRVYANNESMCSIVDPGMARRIVVRKAGSRSTVVWNPGQNGALGFCDFSDGDSARMICVESANAGKNWVELAPNDTHSLRVSYEVQPLD